MSHDVFERFSQNPVLTPRDWPYPVNTVFNAGAVLAGTETVMLVRCEGRSGASHLTVARSADGFTGWRVDEQPTYEPDPALPLEQWGAEDPRLVCLEELDGAFCVTYTGYSPEGPGVCLALTRDFRTFESHGMVFCPENKDAAVFPERLGGDWLMLHRPVAGGTANIWLSRSPDLVHWGRHEPVLRARSGPYWDAGKIGLSAPPMRTDEGWLVLYHGVKHTCFGAIYRQGLALLDLDDPARVIGRTGDWIFAPREDYERMGDVGNVVFCCGWTLVDGEVRMYYGGADTCMAIATARLDDLLALCK